MNAVFPIAAAAFLCLSTAFAAALHRWREGALWFTAAMLGLFPFASDRSDWVGWVDGLKRISIIVPAFLWAFTHARPNHRFTRGLERWLPYLLVVNIVEMALVEFIDRSPACGVLLLAVAACTPLRWTRSGPGAILGFRSPLWLAAYTCTLMRLYVFNPVFENCTVGAIIVLFTAVAICAAVRDSRRFVDWRVYTLYFLVLQDSFFPALSDYLYPAWIHAETRGPLRGNLLDQSWLVLNTVLVTALVVQRLRTLRPAPAVGAPA